uniref:K Homology domain-containing protein n=1 Tax=Salix viminalis TaxID=40686 RepID=A0A6N2N839_SALVM
MVSGNLARLLFHPTNDPRAAGSVPGRLGGRVEPPPPAPATSFGVYATTTRISVDASLAGPIIGKGGVHSKQICRQTGTKLSIKDHETNPNLKNIELEGSLEQIAQASKMIEELVRVTSANALQNPLGVMGAMPTQEATIRLSCVTILPKALALLVKGAILLTGLPNCASHQCEWSLQFS